jgi:dihydrofolate reductase
MSIMGTVRVHMSRSLDGFVTGPDVSLGQPMGVGGERLHEWMFAASDATDIETPAEMFSTRTTGAVVMGRRTFDLGEQPWGEDGTFHLPCFVLTHRAAPTLVKGRRRDVRVVEGARLESEAVERHRATPRDVNAYAISELALQNDSSVCVCKPRCSSRL